MKSKVLGTAYMNDSASIQCTTIDLQVHNATAVIGVFLGNLRVFRLVKKFAVYLKTIKHVNVFIRICHLSHILRHISVSLK